MTFDVIKKKSEERRRAMQARSMTSFVKWINDTDTQVVKLVPPYEGYDREVRNMTTGKMQPKVHYRMQILGDWNFYAKKPISNPRLELTIDDVRNLKDIDAKIWTTPFNAAQGIQREIELGHSILQIRRDGAARSTNTSYNVMYAMSIYDNDWDCLLPKLSREDVAKLQSEEQWNEINPVDLEILQKMGIKNG